MSYSEIIILGYIANAILWVFTLVIGVILGIFSLIFIDKNTIFRFQKVRADTYELKAKMKPEHFRAEQIEFFAGLLIPYAMVYKVGILFVNLVKADFDLVNVSYIKLQQIKDKYGL